MVNTVWGMLLQLLFEITEAAPLPLVFLPNRLKYMPLLKLVPQPRLKPQTFILTVSMPLGQFITLEYYGNNEMSLPPGGMRLKMALMSKMYQMSYFASCSINKVLGRTRLDSLPGGQTKPPHWYFHQKCCSQGDQQPNLCHSPKECSPR